MDFEPREELIKFYKVRIGVRLLHLPLRDNNGMAEVCTPLLLTGYCDH